MVVNAAMPPSNETQHRTPQQVSWQKKATGTLPRKGALFIFIGNNTLG